MKINGYKLGWAIVFTLLLIELLFEFYNTDKEGFSLVAFILVLILGWAISRNLGEALK